MPKLVKKEDQESLFCGLKFHWISKTKYENIGNKWAHKKGSPGLISWRILTYYSLLESWRVVDYGLVIFNLFRCEKPFNLYGFEIEWIKHVIYGRSLPGKMPNLFKIILLYDFYQFWSTNGYFCRILDDLKMYPDTPMNFFELCEKLLTRYSVIFERTLNPVI